MNIHDQKIVRIINSYLTGTLNSEGREILLNWLRDNKEHVRQFRSYCKNWEPADSEELENSWNRFRIKTALHEEAGNFTLKPKPTRIAGSFHYDRILFQRIAAVLMIGVIMTFLLVDRFNDRKSLADSQWICAETVAGQKAKITLPDSSVVWLNSETSLSFPPDFDCRKKRLIRLQGEAFFDVAHNNSEFIVQCNDYDVVVKGTRFNVMAYQDLERTETTLVEGSVMIRKGKQSLNLTPGERAVYSGDHLGKSKAQVRQATLWKENKFYFDNVPFKELVRRLERWYDVRISLQDESLNDIYYSGYFKNEETVWQVLDVIQMTTPIVYKRDKFREITIERKLN